MDPPSRVVSEGLPLLITCPAPGDTSERRFHFYKDRAEIGPGDAGSEISTVEPGTGSMNVSVLSIPQAGPNSTGEFTCGYEENVGGSDLTVTGFQFSRAARQIISSGNSDTHTLSYRTQKDTGSYTCVYWAEPSGHRMKSVETPTVSINVTCEL
ncbi:alpha/beta hydrolase [Platysternon megacephalum]|uniref:Alpha/beta hydrolase n=1 Tax=Platysternon megacephalum TaxID=55544 RepID=A0A4D9DJA5_9SAUR|nr:alpha/beta hydrolase [Platysternon megacephalum]